MKKEREEEGKKGKERKKDMYLAKSKWERTKINKERKEDGKKGRERKKGRKKQTL